MLAGAMYDEIVASGALYSKVGRGGGGGGEYDGAGAEYDGAGAEYDLDGAAYDDDLAGAAYDEADACGVTYIELTATKIVAKIKTLFNIFGKFESKILFA